MKIACFQNGEHFLQDSFNCNSGSPTLYLRCHTSGCIWVKTVHTSESITDKYGHRLHCSEMPAKMIYAFLLSGLTYQNYEEVLDILDVDHFSQPPQFNVYCQKMESVVTNLLEPILLSNRNQLQDSGKTLFGT